jgi:Outer membrane lipoprotein-sorting protein
MKVFLFLITIPLTVALGGCSGNQAYDAPTPTPSPQAPLPDVDSFIKKIITQDGCKDSTANMQIVIAGSSAGSGELRFQVERKYDATGVSTLLRVTLPPDESDRTLLAFERPDQPTTAMSYLPGLKKVARIGSDSQINFREARVTVQELLGLELGQYNHSAGERVSEKGEPAIKAELIQKPDRQLAFPKIDAYFRERDGAPIRFDLYDGRGSVAKAVSIAEIKEIQGHQTVTHVDIDDHTQNLKLKLLTQAINYDRGLSDKLFTEENLISIVTQATERMVAH